MRVANAQKGEGVEGCFLLMSSKSTHLLFLNVLIKFHGGKLNGRTYFISSKRLLILIANSFCAAILYDPKIHRP